MGQRGLPTIARLVDELDGLYYGISLYELAMFNMHWSDGTNHVSTPAGESLTFYSPWSEGLENVRGQFRVLYYQNYPKKCIPTSTEFEVEIRETTHSSLFIKSATARDKDGATLRLYRKDGDCAYPLWGHPAPWVLNGTVTARVQKYQRYLKGDPPTFREGEGGMVYLANLALACAVSWRSLKMKDLPGLGQLSVPLEKMIRATFDYDQKLTPP